MKKLLFLFVVSLFLLVSCNINISNNRSSSSNINTTTNTSIPSSNKSSVTSPKPSEDNTIDVLVVYFSPLGEENNIVNKLASSYDADTFEIKPLYPYNKADLDFNNPSSRVSIEYSDPYRQVELITIYVENFEKYDYIFIGAPIWYGKLSWVINDFIINNEFYDKTIIPFGVSDIFDLDVSNIKELAPYSKVVDGKKFSSRASEKDINDWMKEVSSIID